MITGPKMKVNYNQRLAVMVKVTKFWKFKEQYPIKLWQMMGWIAIKTKFDCRNSDIKQTQKSSEMNKASTQTKRKQIMCFRSHLKLVFYMLFVFFAVEDHFTKKIDVAVSNFQTFVTIITIVWHQLLLFISFLRPCPPPLPPKKITNGIQFP